MVNGCGQSGSSVLLDEYFSSEDPRFLAELRKSFSAKKLAGLAERWKRDPRPWARRQILAYLAQPLNCPGHEPLVKRLFKHAEHQRDDELMAAFLVAFDRLIRRGRKSRYRYDWQTREVWQEEYLTTPRDTLPRDVRPWTDEELGVTVRIAPSHRLFSYHTRYYLRRRVWRYFRWMGYQRPDDYPPAVARALKRYTDDDFAKGENILDNWSLMQACFRRHDALEFRTCTVRLRQGRGLAELTPAPRFAGLWRKGESMPVLLSVVTEAPSRFVRLWAMNLLRAEHTRHLASLGPEDLLGLLENADGEIQQFGAELLQNASGLESLELPVWLRLLRTPNPTALAVICDVMKQHVRPERLGLDQCLELACAGPAPVARLGFDFLKQRSIVSPDDRKKLVRLADAACAAIAGELTAFALAALGAPGTYDREAATAFFDSLQPEARAAAWAWLTPDSPGYADPALWCRLLETPFDDIRMRLIDCLQQRAELPGTAADALAPVWCSVLAGVHRGGRQKPKAVRQIARAMQADPALAARLLPVLIVAVRSVRRPERRAGLSAVVWLVEACPDLADTVAAMLPELRLSPKEAAS